jgi:anti-sigma factor RsiW
MSESFDRITDDELHAFVDAQLDPARIPALLAWLQANPADATRVREWQAQNLQLRQLARAVDLDDTPPALTDVVLRALVATRRRA